MEERQTPEWLAGLSLEAEETPPSEESEKRGMVNRLIDSVRRRPGQAGMEDLREQLAAQPNEERPPARRFLNLRPWQMFVLSVLLFLNVALCGGMLLLMLGRVMP